MGGCKLLLWIWLCGKPGWCFAPVFKMTKPSPFQDAPATCWERGRTCRATTRRGGASACPMWWGTTATSARPSTGRWGAARAAGPAAATRGAPAAPSATRYHPATLSILRADSAYFGNISFSFPCLLSCVHLQACLLFSFPSSADAAVRGCRWQWLSCTAKSAAGPL